jgi:hypothetical protein
LKHELLKVLNVTQASFDHDGFVLRLKIREGVPEAVIRRFATVQHNRWQLLIAFASSIFLEDMAKTMACSNINWEIHEGHLYISCLIDADS